MLCSEAVNNRESNFKEVANKLNCPTPVIEENSIVVVSVAQVRYEWKIRRHLDLVVVHVGIHNFWQGPFKFMTNAQFY